MANSPAGVFGDEGGSKAKSATTRSEKTQLPANRSDKNSLTANSSGSEPVPQNGAAELSSVNESAALAFAKQHHFELAELLVALKKSNKSQYVAALRELDRDRDRIEKLSERDKERAEISLGIWKTDSRIRLAMARFMMTQDAEHDARIRELLKQRQELRLANLQLEKMRSAARLSKLDEQIAAAAENLSEAKLAVELDRMKKAVKTKRPVSPSDPKTSKSK